MQAPAFETGIATEVNRVRPTGEGCILDGRMLQYNGLQTGCDEHGLKDTSDFRLEAAGVVGGLSELLDMKHHIPEVHPAVPICILILVMADQDRGKQDEKR